MGIDDVFERLREIGVNLRLEHGRLVAAAPKGVIDDSVKALIAGNKQALLDHLGGLSLAPERALSIVPGARGAVVPLSHGQEGLLFLDELEKGSTNYNMVAGLRIEGALDIEALRGAIELVVARQEALRIRIVREGGKARQIAVPAERFELEIADATPEAIEAEVRAETERPFDLDGGALFRARLLRIAADEHVLIVALHHVIGDGWSLGILAQEISAAYPAAAGGEAEALPPIDVSYLDYVGWMHRRMEEGLLAEQLAYWKSTLDGAPAVLDFGLDRRRPARRGNRGSAEHLTVPGELLDAVQAHAREEGTTLFMYLLAAFNILASRYSGQDDIVLGTPLANRAYAEVEPLVGFFVNTMVLRNRVPASATVRELLRSVKASTLGALRNSDVSFPQVVEQIAPERSLSHSPIFQVNFGLQNAPTSELTLGDLKLVPVGFTTQSTKFDLSVNAAVENGGLVVSAEYSTDLYEAETVRAILADYRSLLEAMVGRSDARIGLLAIDSLDRRMAGFSGASDAGVSGQPSVLALLADAARQNGDRAAAEQGERAIGHAELARRSDRLAAMLASLGSATGKVVAIAARPSLDFVVAIIAVLKTGAAYLPLDPDAPESRLAAILADAAPALVLCDEEDIANPALACWSPRPVGRLLAAAPDAAFETAAPDPSEIAYIIYTSGSTGVPKGVEVTHGGLANLIGQLVPAMKLTPDDRVLQFTPTTFDVSVQEIFSTLAAGAALVFPPRNQVKVGDPLARFLRDRVVTVATLPPSVLVSTSPETLPHLRLVVTGAEAISGEVVDAWGCGRDFFYNYGPTETTVTATARFCAPGGDRPTIGRPLDNVRVHIVDASLAPAPVNVVGEVLIGGAGIARGYVADPVKTAVSFIPDHFSAVPGARLYRTGDLARFRADGEIEFVGRNDTQVKLRGFRIELGEVEAALRGHAAVADAVAVVADDISGQPRLVGYVRAAQAGDPRLTDDLREHMRGAVPHYMVPAAIVALDSFPVTVNGKVDKAALPAPFTAEAEAAPAAGDGLEAEIAAIFTAAIGVDGIGLDDSFFEAGGDSLLAVQAVSRINEQLQIELNLAEIFEFPTVRELARRVAAARDELAELLSQVEAMSEAEANILLRAQ